ncbi:MAG: hypothetical protein NTZ83_06690 [Candidatus Pacearchaeota archaeon]|nr:hypothetical protein [Candidatus Pacearchaeota archaeon]
MNLKKLIEKHKEIKRNGELTKKLIQGEIAKYLRVIIPKADYAELDGTRYTVIKEKVDKQFKFKVPDNYVFETLDSMEDISKSEGRYALKNH